MFVVPNHFVLLGILQFRSLVIVSFSHPQTLRFAQKLGRGHGGCGVPALFDNSLLYALFQTNSIGSIASVDFTLSGTITLPPLVLASLKNRKLNAGHRFLLGLDRITYGQEQMKIYCDEIGEVPLRRPPNTMFGSLDTIRGIRFLSFNETISRTGAAMSFNAMKRLELTGLSFQYEAVPCLHTAQMGLPLTSVRHGIHS